MNKSAYIKPLTTAVGVNAENNLLNGSWGVDGDHKPVIEGDPEKPLDAKENGFWDSEDTGWED